MVYLSSSKVDRAGDAAVSKALDIALGGAAPLRVQPAQAERVPSEDPTLRSELLRADRAGAGWCLRRRTPQGSDHFLCALERKGA